MAVGPIPVLADDYVFLLGRPPVTEFLGFMHVMSVDAATIDENALAAEWRAGSDRAHLLAAQEPGYANNPEQLPLLPNQEPLAAKVLTDPMLQRAYGALPVRIAQVELDKLVVHQKYINLEFVNQLKESLPAPLTDLEIAKLTLGIERAMPPVHHARTGQNAYDFVSSSNDLRFLEDALVSPQPVAGYTSSGQAVALLVLAVGWGSNYFSAVHVENRLILNNGSHRAYALRELGVTHAPCVIREVAIRDELELVGIADLSAHPERYLEAERPPVLKDYFDPNLRKIVSVARKNRLVRLKFGFEQSEIPAT